MNEEDEKLCTVVWMSYCSVPKSSAVDLFVCELKMKLQLIRESETLHAPAQMCCRLRQSHLYTRYLNEALYIDCAVK